jgi:hypothetical protein
LDPNSYDAAYAKYHYLKPRWHGSFQQERRFAYECIESTTWGGNVPLIMVDLHRDNAPECCDERKEYFARPDVWKDLHAAFQKYFKNPNAAVGWHHDYFYYAHAAGQWDIAKEQLQLMGNKINYDYFGGKLDFDAMVEEVRKHTAQTSP